jgi:hypothetical protein
MGDYPEHDKLMKISDDSRLIGEFIDYGLPKQGLVLYEKRLFECECDRCSRKIAASDDGRHNSADDFKNGVAFYGKMTPTHKTIQQILAAYFEIDQDQIDAEKEQMLADMRALNP